MASYRLLICLVFNAIDSMSQDSPELLSIRAQIADAVSSGRKLSIRGGNTKQFYGHTCTAEPLAMDAYAGIVSYEPTELVVTVRAGTRLSDLREELAAQGQMLAFEPPSFGAESTIGGVIAAGLSGPRRASAGSARDFLLGVNMIDSQGQWLSFGGQVMKNVAGYDVSRLLCGSLGVLGIIAEVSLKVLPKPAAERSMQLAVSEVEGIKVANTLAGQPLPMSATAWHDDQLTIRFSGAQSAVDSACTLMANNHDAVQLNDADDYWQALCDQNAPFFAQHMPFESPNVLWRLSVPGTAPVIDLPGEQLIEWVGSQRWLRSDAPAQAVRAAVAAVGGHATAFRTSDASIGVFDELSAVIGTIHRRLKAELDPHQIFNPGRMYPDL